MDVDRVASLLNELLGDGRDQESVWDGDAVRDAASAETETLLVADDSNVRDSDCV